MIDKSWQRLNAEQKLEWLLTEVLRNASHTIDLGNQMDERLTAVDVKLQIVADDLAVLNSRTEEETV
jgi:hypothetical protein